MLFQDTRARLVPQDMLDHLDMWVSRDNEEILDEQERQEKPALQAHKVHLACSESKDTQEALVHQE